MTKEEKDKASELFLMQNGSIIYNLHKEDAINSYIKDAFIAGIELGEKAHKEEVLGKAKRELDSKGISCEEVKLIFRIFPELCKSEDDKIREEIVEFLDNIWHLGKNANLEKWDKCDCAKWICWLEKQKPTSWSEMDIKMIDDIIDEVRPLGECPDYPTDEEREYYYKGQDRVDWLERLKKSTINKYYKKQR